MEEKTMAYINFNAQLNSLPLACPLAWQDPFATYQSGKSRLSEGRKLNLK